MLLQSLEEPNRLPLERDAYVASHATHTPSQQNLISLSQCLRDQLSGFRRFLLAYGGPIQLRGILGSDVQQVRDDQLGAAY
ncbi:hypothetical protein OHA77_24725 [Streptosporangium sp. NBC_01639]|nr:hypothetical protein OHA77_24725 [Streptosporangium sp. NBC_01639]